MKKFFLIALAMLVLSMAACGKKDSSEVFYKQKEALTELQNGKDELVQVYKEACREAVEKEGYIVKDDYIQLWTHFSGLDMAGMNYGLLTDKNEYILFKVEEPDYTVLRLLSGEAGLSTPTYNVNSFDEEELTGVIGYSY